jgi:cell division protein FtsB
MGEAFRRRLVRTLLAAAWLGGGYYFFLGGEYSVLDLHDLRAERDSVAVRVDSLRERADSLEARAESLATEPTAIERLARERYGFIRDGERLYRFVAVEDRPEPDS